MGSSSGPTSTTTQGIDPSLSAFMGPIGQLASNYINTPYQQYPGMQVAPLSPTQNQAIGGISGLMGGNGSTNAANQYLTNTLSVNPASDPNVQAMIDAAKRQTTLAYDDATQGITSRYNQTGNFGGVRNQMAQDRANTDLATGLANGTAGIMDQAYEAAANRQAAAVPMAGSLYSTLMGGLNTGLNAGGLEQQYGQNLLNAQQGNFNNYVNYLPQQLGNIGNLIGAFTGATPRTTTTQGPPPDPFSQGLGVALLGSRLGSSGGSKAG